jgi:hypothetical protein
MRLWKIRPLKLVTTLAKDFFITTSFASSFKAPAGRNINFLRFNFLLLLEILFSRDCRVGL